VSREGWIQLACLYGPMLGAGLLAWWLRPSGKSAVGLLFSFAWVAALLPWVDGLARLGGCWSYRVGGLSLAGMPLALYLGWVIAWGLFAPLLVRVVAGRMWTAVALLVAIDLRAMPELTPLLMLQPWWWAGEMVVVAVVLVPALFLERWTETGERLEWRCAMLVPAFGGIFLGLPALVECGDPTAVFERWRSLPEVWRAMSLLAGLAFSIPGLTAVRDLAKSGRGTPVPLDPPQRLVTHGIYAFVRNPMQLSMTSLLVLESLMLGTPWPAILAGLGVVYSEGFARWSEQEDMLKRFGPAWTAYRASVRPWIPAWRPKVGRKCELWLDEDCGPCAEVARWLEKQQPAGLQLRPAAEWMGDPLTRVTWRDPLSGRAESGVAGMAMALQHLTLPWACLGCLAGLPGISHVLQICFDAAGAGKRERVGGDS